MANKPVRWGGLYKRRYGANTPRGTKCMRWELFKNGRCRNHGGLCTGPKTEETKRRVTLNWNRKSAEKHSQIYRKRPTFPSTVSQLSRIYLGFLSSSWVQKTPHNRAALPSWAQIRIPIWDF